MQWSLVDINWIYLICSLYAGRGQAVQREGKESLRFIGPQQIIFGTL